MVTGDATDDAPHGGVLGVVYRIGRFAQNGLGLRSVHRKLGLGGGRANRQLLLTCYLLAVVAGSLLMIMREIDGVLRQMHVPGAPSGGALGLPFDGGTARSIREAWEAYQSTAATTRTVAKFSTLLVHLSWLDALFILTYGCLLAVVLGALRARVTSRPSARALDKVLDGTKLTLGLLVVVDVLEDLCLYLGYGRDIELAFGVGGILSILKIVLALAVLLPLLFAVAFSLHRSERVRTALASTRVAVAVLVATAALLLFLRIGTEQVDDVVRAWGAVATLCAIAASAAAVVVVRGAMTALTGEAAEKPEPPDADDSRPILLGAAIVLAGLGLVAVLLPLHAWGLFVAAALALLLWVLDLVAGRLELRRRSAADKRQREPDPVEEPEKGPPAGVDAAGFLLARLCAAFVTAVLIWVVIRAATFDLFVRVITEGTTFPWKWLVLLLSFVAVQIGLGVVALDDRYRPARGRWRWVAGGAVVVLWATFLVDGFVQRPDRFAALRLPMTLGTVAVLLLALAAGAGGSAVVIAWVRSVTVRYRMPRALRLVGLRRFPVVALLLVWVLLVALIDGGGFHDVRRQLTGGTTASPSLEEAYDRWSAAGPAVTPGAARPLVLVAAQGGGIRAAIWTALVMECVFGPSPVRSKGEDVCQGGGGGFDRAVATTSAARPLPVFLASGASGGSVGLAAWAGRRLDLEQGGAVAAAVPESVNDVLTGDYVAADLARLLSGDTLYGVLAHSGPDRAAVLERAWELAWGADVHAGMSRGLRESWALANSGPGRWGMPVLAMNASQVEDGCRFVASPVDFTVSSTSSTTEFARSTDDEPDDRSCGSDGPPPPPTADGGPPAPPAAGASPRRRVVDALPNTTELIDYLCPGQDVPLSAAAHLSARFPFVSPPGRVEGCEGDGLLGPDATSYAIDGGYFDNSGAATALDAWRALTPFVAGLDRARSTCVVPLFLQIDNSPSGGAASGGDPVPFPLAAPAQAVLSQLSARQRAESEAARFAFAPPRSADGRAVEGIPAPERRRPAVDPPLPPTAYFRVAPAAQPGPTPPLGWTLSPTTVDDMRAQLTADANRETIKRLRDALSNPLTCTSLPGSVNAPS